MAEVIPLRPTASTPRSHDPGLSLFQLLDPAVHADPYPFYARLREEAPVHWDAFMHCWVVTRYDDVLTVLNTCSADRTPDAAAITALGLPDVAPVAEMMARQMLFLDAPTHTRLRQLCSTAFTPRRVKHLEATVRAIADTLIDAVIERGAMDVIYDFAEPFPAIVTAGLLGVPRQDHRLLKQWSSQFAEMLGNFQHNPERVGQVLASVEEMTAYFQERLREHDHQPTDGLIGALRRADVNGVRLTDEEIVANVVVTMVGGQETTTNLIGNGLLTLLRQPEQLAALRQNPAAMPNAVEELLRFESPSQHTARIAPADMELGGYPIPKGAAVMAIMAAANRDPLQFARPDHLDLSRTPNRHVAFGWGPHFCFGAALARMEGRIALAALLCRLPDIALGCERQEWRANSGLRGLKALPVTFRTPMQAP